MKIEITTSKAKEVEILKFADIRIREDPDVYIVIDNEIEQEDLGLAVKYICNAHLRVHLLDTP